MVVLLFRQPTYSQSIDGLDPAAIPRDPDLINDAAPTALWSADLLSGRRVRTAGTAGHGG